MVIVSGQVKARARAALKDNRMSAAIMTGIVIGVYVLLAVLSQLVSTVLDINSDTVSVNWVMNIGSIRDFVYLLLKVFGSLFSLALIAPLMLGFERSVVCMYDGRRAEVSDLFYYFGGVRRWLGAVKYKFLLGVRLILWFVLLLIPSAVCAALGEMSYYIFGERYSDMAAGLLGGGQTVLTLAALAVWLIIALGYFAADYCYILGEDSTARGCISHSKRLARGHRAELFGLAVSLFWWIVLCVLLFPALYVVPYVTAAFAFASAQFIGEEKRTSADRASAE